MRTPSLGAMSAESLLADRLYSFSLRAFMRAL
jgi:hypothetical protein